MDFWEEQKDWQVGRPRGTALPRPKSAPQTHWVKETKKLSLLIIALPRKRCVIMFLFLFWRRKVWEFRVGRWAGEADQKAGWAAFFLLLPSGRPIETDAK